MSLFAGAAVAWPLAARAQQPALLVCRVAHAASANGAVTTSMRS
jgi:hypothetical protein